MSSHVYSHTKSLVVIDSENACNSNIQSGSYYGPQHGISCQVLSGWLFSVQLISNNFSQLD